MSNPAIPEGLQSLYEAMHAGKKIKSVRYMRGTSNKDLPEEDLILSNFTMTNYLAGLQRHPDMGNQDYVCTDKGNFYMIWVRDFEL